MKKWQGPGTIVEVKSPYSYLIELDRGQSRWLHANLLKPYHARVNNAVMNNCSIVYESDEDFGSLLVCHCPVSWTMSSDNKGNNAGYKL